MKIDPSYKNYFAFIVIKLYTFDARQNEIFWGTYIQMSQRVDPCAQVGRYFLRKRQGIANNPKEASKPRPRPREVIQQSFFLHDNFNASLLRHSENLQRQRNHLPE